MQNSLTRSVLVIVLLIGGVLYLSFGTLSPCGMLRETVRRHDGLAALLPNALVDAALEGQYGALSPGRCIAILVNGSSTPVVAPVVQQPIAQQPIQQRQAQQIPVAPADPMKVAGKEAETAIMECRAKRFSGELKTYLASTQCANPRILQAFNAAHYKYMDLISLFTAKRAVIAEKMDRNELTEVQGQAENAKIYSEMVEAERHRDHGGR
jgi:hypothetical protein